MTGATGFIGRHLVEQLLRNRDGDVHVLVREDSREKLDALARALAGRPTASSRSSATSSSRTSASTTRGSRSTAGTIEHFFHLAAIYDMTAPDEHQRAPQRRRYPPRRRARQRARRRAPAPRLLGRRGGRLQGPVPRGHVRRGPGPAVGLPPHEVRVRADRPRAVRGAVARLPARDRHRPLADRRDGQDRRALLLLQAHPEGPQRAAAVVPARRPRAGLHEHRAGRLRRPRDGPHRPRARPRRPGVPPHGAEVAALGRGAQHVRPGRARAAARDARRQAPHRRAAQGRRVADARSCPR